MDLNDIRETLATERTNRARLFGELENLRARTDGDSAGVAERIANVNRGVESADARIADLEAEYGRTAERAAYLEQQGGDRRNVEGEPVTRVQHRHVNEAREKALRVIERHQDAFDDDAATRTERLVRQDDPRDWLSRYLAAVGSDGYRSAFAKLVADPQNGHLRFGPEEVEAVRTVSALDSERAMSVGSNPGGGFALPLTLDPSILLTSSGSLNPIRQLARTITTSTNIWNGVASDGVTVTYRAEAATMADNSPTLVGPSITCRRWDAFIPYSWEVGADWPGGGLENELVRLIADGRDQNDSTIFYSGTSSSNQPNGIMASLGTTQQTQTVGTATLAAGDIWALKEAIPARFQPNASWLSHPTLLDKTYRLVPNASTSEPALMETRDGAVVGKPAYEWSSLGTSTNTSATIAIAGDVRNAYTIVDRIGLTAIPVPVLFSGNTAGGFGYPTGQSGLIVWGRTGAGVVNVNALRVLTVR